MGVTKTLDVVELVFIIFRVKKDRHLAPDEDQRNHWHETENQPNDEDISIAGGFQRRCRVLIAVIPDASSQQDASKLNDRTDAGKVGFLDSLRHVRGG